jgi:DNA-binding NarL/FixJ family response regulator
MPITVAIVEDHKDIRMGMAYTLRASPAYVVAGEYETAEDCIRELDETVPEVILMDINLPGMSGIEATSVIKARQPRTEIVILSVMEDDENVFQAICSGANGYVTKPVLPAQLTECIDEAFSGGTPFSPNIARRVLELFRHQNPPPRADYRLTPREMDVLHCLVQGDDYKLIAEKLYLSLFTVRAHIRNIYDKLHVHSKSQAVAKALQDRLVRPPTK